ncbi:small EDRK-rich factor 2-like [Zalophus californianus]|uniref:Small EDRK-rich factor 2 n=1 Tax=Zalophus californianus TaxID=9704 RepID=A0A6J2B099_ZALCA|nr:small EDRK-rich factor 2-like [Zalophus californianus]
MTRGNQRELARQNMKKQSDSVKGKRPDDGLSAAARKRRCPIISTPRDSEIMQQKQKKANEKKEEPK